MAKYSIETTYLCINDDTGKTVFKVSSDSDGIGLINIETISGSLTSEECKLLVTAIKSKIEDNEIYLSKVD